MPWHRDFPSWLKRRRYFKRMGRWAKPRMGRSGQVRPGMVEQVPAGSDAETAWVLPANVLPFPVRPGMAQHLEQANRRGIGSA